MENTHHLVTVVGIHCMGVMAHGMRVLHVSCATGHWCGLMEQEVSLEMVLA